MTMQYVVNRNARGKEINRVLSRTNLTREAIVKE